jgi:hypothetical protein
MCPQQALLEGMVGKLARQTEAEDSAKELAVKQSALLQQRAQLIQVQSAGVQI